MEEKEYWKDFQKLVTAGRTIRHGCTARTRRKKSCGRKY